MNINQSEPNVERVVFPKDFLTHIHLGRCAYDYRGLCSSPGASFADLNVWGRAMSESEMQVIRVGNEKIIIRQRQNHFTLSISGMDNL